jgi:hypothetical protein
MKQKQSALSPSRQSPPTCATQWRQQPIPLPDSHTTRLGTGSNDQ